MKIRGRHLSGPRVKIVPILRDENEGGTIFIQVQAVTDVSPFFNKCPLPEPPILKLPGNRTRPDFDSAVYKAQLDKWLTQKAAWMAIQSLAKSEIEWETVDPSNPETYENWSKEMMSAGFADAEIQRIAIAMQEVNGVNEAMVEEARQSFLTGQASLVNGQSYQKADPVTISSGEAVSK